MTAHANRIFINRQLERMTGDIRSGTDCIARRMAGGALIGIARTAVAVNLNRRQTIGANDRRVASIRLTYKDVVLRRMMNHAAIAGRVGADTAVSIGRNINQFGHRVGVGHHREVVANAGHQIRRRDNIGDVIGVIA